MGSWKKQSVPLVFLEVAMDAIKKGCEQLSKRVLYGAGYGASEACVESVLGAVARRQRARCIRDDAVG